MNANPETALAETARINSLRAAWIELGYNPVPVKTRDKNPGFGEWQVPEVARAKIAEGVKADRLSTGLLTAGLRAFDVDTDDAEKAASIDMAVLAHCGPAPRRWRDNSPRSTWIYRAAEGAPPVRNAAGEGESWKLQVLGSGQHTMVDGEHPEQPDSFFHVEDLPPLGELSAVTEQQVSDVFAEIIAKFGGKETGSGTTNPRPEGEAAGDPFASIEDVEAALAVIPNGGPKDWDFWTRIMMATWAATDGSEEGLAAAHKWSKKNPDYNFDDTEERWSGITNSPPDQIGFGSLVFEARKHVPGWQTPSHVADVKERAGTIEQTEAAFQANPLPNPQPSIADIKSAASPASPDDAKIARLAAMSALEYDRVRVAEADLMGCRVATLDKLVQGARGDDDDEYSDNAKASQADLLVRLSEMTDLFTTDDGSVYADVQVGGHRETWPVKSRGFKLWLTRRFYEETRGAASPEAFSAAIGVVEAKANYSAPVRPVAVRVGAVDGKIYLDLADADWRAVEIDAAGWRIVTDPPVRFRRYSGTSPLPTPQHGGSIAALRPFLNVKNDTDFALTIAWLLGTLRGDGPFPILVLSGEQGSAKSTFTKFLRLLVDPISSPLRSLSREERDLFISATRMHFLAFDNVSGMPHSMSDILCRIATGGGFACRALYTDGEEITFNAKRPVVLNGIEDVITRPDLADRAIFLTLEPITEGHRRPEDKLLAEFDAVRPGVLGALLDVVSHGLRMRPHTTLTHIPRMADFALWATACEGAMWPAGTFMTAYEANRAAATLDVVENDPVAASVRALMADSPDGRWEGTAADLLPQLRLRAGEVVARSKNWPNLPHLLTNRLKRAATFLRKIGVEVEFARTKAARTVTISYTAAEKGRISASPASPSQINQHVKGDARAPHSVTPSVTSVTPTAARAPAGDARPAVHPLSVTPSVTFNPLKTRAGDAGDAGDAEIRPFWARRGEEHGAFAAPVVSGGIRP